nr:DUF362 domain-containing protein [Candidatus Njordarchaeota archaeon]
MEKAKVSITKFENPERTILTAVRLIGGVADLDCAGFQVIIKPGIFDPSRPPYTDIRVAKAVTSLFHNTKDISFAESDNPLRTGMEALVRTGYNRINRVGLVDLSSSLSQVKRGRLRLLKGQRFSKFLLNTDILLNLPVMKGDPKTGAISIGLKNLFGLIPDKMKPHYHRDLDEVLIELLKIFKPSLTIVDATTAYVGSYPDYKPVNSRLIIAGRDVVAVDAVCCNIMGMNPARVRYLALAAKAKKGTLDVNGIEVLGLQLVEARELFLGASRSPSPS